MWRPEQQVRRICRPLRSFAFCLCAALLLAGVEPHAACAVEGDDGAPPAVASSLWALGSSMSAMALEMSDGPVADSGDNAGAHADGNQETQPAEGDGQDEDASKDKVEPMSEVVTSYYHDAWYEASKGEGDKSASEGEREDAKTGDSADEDEGDEADARESESVELDAELNDLGSGNYVNPQQTSDSSFLYDTNVVELLDGDRTYQRTTVQVTGEVVGDAMRAEQNEGKYWLTLRDVKDDREGSISVLVDEAVVRAIDTYGSYNKTGTTLRVKGTFFMACSSHEGIMDIHADSVTVVAPGYTVNDEFELPKLVPGVVLCALGALLTALYSYLAERER